MATSLSDFTSTFVLSSVPHSEQDQQILFEVPKALLIDPFRQRRVHQKSKTGCENCKRRRVKCNEENPCEYCSRRGECCQRLIQRNRATSTASISPMPARIISLNSKSTDPVVNLFHMKLFHHFQTYTCQTLLLPPKVWEYALQLSFQFEFMMNSILCIGARHLAILQPEDPKYPMVATRHLCRALSQFRHELSNNLTTTHVDAFIATSGLLQYEVWSNTENLSLDDAMVSLDPSRDRMFVFCSGLKQVFLKSLSHTSIQASILLPHLQQNPEDILVEVSQISSETFAKYQEYFSYRRPPNLELLGIPLCHRVADPTISNMRREQVQQSPNPIEEGYMDVITRICLILSFLPEAQPLCPMATKSPFFPEFKKYIFFFPVTCHGPFASMVEQNDLHALVLLYHFYRAVRILLPPKECWWASKRATVFEMLLKEWLTKTAAKQDQNTSADFQA